MEKVAELISTILLNIIGPNGENTGIVVILALLSAAVAYLGLRTAKPLAHLQEWALQHEIIKHQMNKADEYMVLAEGMLKSNFLKMRVSEIGDKEHVAGDGEVHRYSYIIKDVLSQMRAQIRFFFRENHLSEMTEREFISHAEKRADIIIGQFTAALDVAWWPGTQPTRTEVYDSQQLLVPKGKELIKALFAEGRQISIEMRKNKELKSKHGFS